MARERSMAFVNGSWRQLMMIITSARQSAEDGKFDAMDVSGVVLQGAALAQNIIAYVKTVSKQDLDDLMFIAENGQFHLPE